MKSILHKKDGTCYLCLLKSRAYLGITQEHHVFGASNRKKSEKHGLKVYLCIDHHTGSNEAVHHNRENDLLIKRIAQKRYEEMYSKEEFIKEFGKSWEE